MKLGGLIEAQEGTVAWLKEMRDAGVTLDPCSADDYYTLLTEDPQVAERFGMEALELGEDGDSEE